MQRKRHFLPEMTPSSFSTSTPETQTPFLLFCLFISDIPGTTFRERSSPWRESRAPSRT